VTEISKYINDCKTVIEDFTALASRARSLTDVERFEQFMFYGNVFDNNYKDLNNTYKYARAWPDIANTAQYLQMRAVGLISRKYITFN
jgi:hypothetical protein